eukprot:gene13630-11667_t
MRGCCAAALARAERASDTAAEKQRKETFLPVVLAFVAYLLPLSVLHVHHLAGGGGERHVARVGNLVLFLV